MPNPDDTTIRTILERRGTVAVVGWSPNPERPSHGVAAFLERSGWRVIRVNPGQAGALFADAPVYGRLSDIPPDAGVTMVDIFRRSDAVAGVVDEALAVLPALDTIWMQLDVRDEVAAMQARDRGITVVQDRCPVIEARRLGL